MPSAIRSCQTLDLIRTFGWLIVLVLNVALGLLPAALIVESDLPFAGRLTAGFAVVVVWAAVLLLISARVGRLPSWGISVMRWLCLSYAVLWLLGSLDNGILSGQELWSVFLVALLAWGTWKAFMLFAVRDLTSR